MGQTLTEKILSAHRTADGGYLPDHTLVHDMSGLLAFMGFGAMNLPRINVERAFIFNDHNLVGMSPSTAADQRFMRSCAKRYGAVYSEPGHGICHSLYYHDFARPGCLLAGADSHTATAGALGMLGVGMGGMDIAVAMSGVPVFFPEPRVVRVTLEGALRPGVSAKDAALALLAKIGVKGFLGCVAEYGGEGAASLSIHQRATLCNMGAEAGATSSVFPSDETTRRFLAARGREAQYKPLAADANAVYDSEIRLNLTEVEPMVALPGEPDYGVPISQAERESFSQIVIGSCTNGSYIDLARAAALLRGRRVSPDVNVFLQCGSREIMNALQKNGWLSVYLEAGVRVLECGCGPCMGIGQMPEPGATILRSTNRNFPGRSGTGDARMFLCSAETAAASAVSGTLTSPFELSGYEALAAIPDEEQHEKMPGYVEYAPSNAPILMGDNIRPLPVREKPPESIEAEVVLSLGDGISTDDIVPPQQHVLTLRTNIPALAEHLFAHIDPTFPERAKAMGSSIIVGGANYAQGSSREHAAIGCMVLGVEAVLAVSMHRIHRANLINYGVLPLIFERAEDRALIERGDKLSIAHVREQLAAGERITVRNLTRGCDIIAKAAMTEREKEIWRAGGLVPWVCARRKEGGQS